MTDEIINKVAGSGLVNIEMDDLLPPGERVLLDIAPALFEGLLLREKDFRAFVAEHDWEQYRGKFVAVQCSADAIVPTWAYMLVGVHLEPVAAGVVFGTMDDLLRELFREAIQNLDVETYHDKRVLIHGCGRIPVPPSAFLDISVRLKPVVKSLMFGEACSTVPIYKKG